MARAHVLDGGAARLDVIPRVLAVDRVREVAVRDQLDRLLDQLTESGDEPEDQDDGEQELVGAT